MSCAGGVASAGEAIVTEEAATARMKAPNQEAQGRNSLPISPCLHSPVSSRCLSWVNTSWKLAIRGARGEGWRDQPADTEEEWGMDQVYGFRGQARYTSTTTSPNTACVRQWLG